VGRSAYKLEAWPWPMFLSFMDDRFWEVTVRLRVTRTSRPDNYDYNTGDRDWGAHIPIASVNARRWLCCIASHPAFQVIGNTSSLVKGECRSGMANNLPVVNAAKGKEPYKTGRRGRA